jgi:hypothetical protein
MAKGHSLICVTCDNLINGELNARLSRTIRQRIEEANVSTH